MIMDKNKAIKYILENAFRNENRSGAKFIKDGYICDYEKFLDEM